MITFKACFLPLKVIIPLHSDLFTLTLKLMKNDIWWSMADYH